MLNNPNITGLMACGLTVLLSLLSFESCIFSYFMSQSVDVSLQNTKTALLPSRASHSTLFIPKTYSYLITKATTSVDVQTYITIFSDIS